VVRVAGLDVGRANDASAYVELVEEPDSKTSICERCVRLVKTPLPEQARILEPLVSKTDLTFVDMNGIGLGLFEGMLERGLPVVGLSIVGGITLLPGLKRRLTVGKVYLIARLARAIKRGEVRFPDRLENRELLKAELLSLAGTFTGRGGVRIEATRGHDDTAVGLALALLAKDLARRTGFNGQATESSTPRRSDGGGEDPGRGGHRPG
jgi:hypothetical protein